MNEKELVSLALEAGATKATLISREQIVLSAEFREICQRNSCGAYGRCWMCPPDVGEIEPLMARVRQYPRAVLYQTIGQLEDSYDIEGMGAAAAEHVRVSQRLQARLAPLVGPGLLHLSCGGCHLCETCAKQENQPCRHPEQALPSMESYGVNVYETAKDTGLQYCNGQNTVTYFGMALLPEG